jgi:hypothetical protein
MCCQACIICVFLAISAGRGDLPELPPEYERFSRGAVERSGVPTDRLGDELEPLTRAVSRYRQMLRQGDRPQLSVDLLMPLARAYANGVEPMLLGRRHILAATAAELSVEDVAQAGPGTVAERIAIWNQMLQMSQRVRATGRPEAPEQARTLGVGALLMIVTDIPEVAFVMLLSQPPEVAESLRAAGVNIDAMQDWARQSFPKRDALPTGPMSELYRSADLLVRTEQIDPELLETFSRITRRLWPDAQKQLGQSLMLCHYAYGIRLVAQQARDQASLAVLRELSDDLARAANCKVHENWARQIMDLPAVDRNKLAFPRVSHRPYDKERDPP